VIHSKSASPEEVLAFAGHWKRPLPLVAIPTTYYRITAEELERAGFAMVIYANHGLRASIRSMEAVFREILQTGTTAGVEPRIATLKEVFDLQGMKDVREDEKRFSGEEPLRVVIPAARDHQRQTDLGPLLRDRPLCMLEVGGKSLLERQMEALRSVGASEFHIVGGRLHEKIRAEGANVLFNPDHGKYNCAQSVLFAKEHLRGRSLVVYSDILFDRRIPEKLVQSPHPITLVIDRAYASLPAREKGLDLVSAEPSPAAQGGRHLQMELFRTIRRIGRKLPLEPTHEFIGIAFFQDQGAEALKAAWEEAKVRFRGKPFYEAPSVEAADLTDLLQYLMDRGTPVAGMEIEQGWSEIHSRDDYDRVQRHFQKPVSVPA